MKNESEAVTQAPFKRGDLVICSLSYFTVKPGDTLRVIDCTSAVMCESGWLVKATNQVKGQLAKRPPIAVEGVDSGWFKIKGRKS